MSKTPFIDIENKKLDRQVKYRSKNEKYNHGTDIGLRNKYYECAKCNVQFRQHEPFKVHHFKLDGLHYGLPRRIGIMPECPNCQRRDNVRTINKYKKRN